MKTEEKIEQKVKRLNSWIEFCEKELVKIDQCIEYKSGYCEVRFLFLRGGNSTGWDGERIHEDVFFEPQELILLYKNKVLAKKNKMETELNELREELKKELIK